jgi:hypothetical protein
LPARVIITIIITTTILIPPAKQGDGQASRNQSARVARAIS